MRWVILGAALSAVAAPALAAEFMLSSTEVKSEAPPNWWTPLLSSGGSGKVSNGPGTASFYG